MRMFLPIYLPHNLPPGSLLYVELKMSHLVDMVRVMTLLGIYMEFILVDVICTNGSKGK
jgi:hypothetical protein